MLWESDYHKNNVWLLSGGGKSIAYLNEIMCLILKDGIEQKDLDRNNIFDYFWFNFWFEILRNKVMFSEIKNE